MGRSEKRKQLWFQLLFYQNTWRWQLAWQQQWHDLGRICSKIRRSPWPQRSFHHPLVFVQWGTGRYLLEQCRLLRRHRPEYDQLDQRGRRYKTDHQRWQQPWRWFQTGCRFKYDPEKRRCSRLQLCKHQQPAAEPCFTVRRCDPRQWNIFPCQQPRYLQYTGNPCQCRR